VNPDDVPPPSDADSTQRRAAINAKKMVDVVAEMGERIMRRSTPAPRADVEIDDDVDDDGEREVG
jgi:hypothetical protein